MPDEPPDRHHNREEDSPEFLRRSIDDLAEAVAALNQRLDDATMRLGADIEGARAVTRHLAGAVALMGEALVRRIEKTAAPLQVTVSTKPRRSGAAFWIAGAVLLLAAAAAAILFLPTTSDRHVATPPRAAPVVLPTPTLIPQAVSPPAQTTPVMAKRSGSTAVHRWRPHHQWRAPVASPPIQVPANPSNENL